MSKKAVIEKLGETLDALVGATSEADNKPMTASEIATAKAKKKTKGAAGKSPMQTARKKTAPKKKIKKSKR